jgi:hypothetical protein
MGFKCHVSLDDWLGNGHMSQKRISFNCTCSCICNLLYKYEWMKDTNISYVHCMYNMSHATKVKISCMC